MSPHAADEVELFYGPHDGARAPVEHAPDGGSFVRRRVQHANTEQFALYRPDGDGRMSFVVITEEARS